MRDYPPQYYLQQPADATTCSAEDSRSIAMCMMSSPERSTILHHDETKRAQTYERLHMRLLESRNRISKMAPQYHSHKCHQPSIKIIVHVQR